MTALTPQQMRDLADRTLPYRASYRQVPFGVVADMEHALRTAADQLEAVHDVEQFTRALFAQDRHPSLTWEQMPDWAQQEYRDSARGVIAIITADAAPQEGRDE